MHIHIYIYIYVYVCRVREPTPVRLTICKMNSHGRGIVKYPRSFFAMLHITTSRQPRITHITLPWVINWITSLHYSWSRRASKPFDSFRIHDGRYYGDDDAYGGSEIPTWPIWYPPLSMCIASFFSPPPSLLSRFFLHAILLSTIDRPYVTYFILGWNMKKDEKDTVRYYAWSFCLNVKR